MTDKRYWVIHHYEGDHTSILDEYDKLCDAQHECKYYASLPKEEYDLGYEVYDSELSETIEYIEV